MHLSIQRISRRACLKLAALAASVALSTCALAAEPGKIVVQADQPGAKISPRLYGLMTEEINFSYDGGLYAELIQNRIFKNTARGRSGQPSSAPAQIPHWAIVSSESAQGDISLDTSDPVNTDRAGHVLLNCTQ